MRSEEVLLLKEVNDLFTELVDFARENDVELLRLNAKGVIATARDRLKTLHDPIFKGAGE